MSRVRHLRASLYSKQPMKRFAVVAKTTVGINKLSTSVRFGGDLS